MQKHRELRYFENLKKIQKARRNPEVTAETLKPDASKKLIKKTEEHGEPRNFIKSGKLKKVGK